MKWKLVLLALLVVAILGIAMTEGVITQKQLQPNALPFHLVSIHSTAKGKQAVYELRNDSDSTVDVWAAATLHVGASAEYKVQEIRIEPATIERGNKSVVQVPVPEGKGWQVQLRVAPHQARRATVVFSEWSQSDDK